MISDAAMRDTVGPCRDPFYSPPRYGQMRLSDVKGSSETCADVSHKANPWR